MQPGKSTPSKTKTVAIPARNIDDAASTILDRSMATTGIVARARAVFKRRGPDEPLSTRDLALYLSA